MTVLYHTMQKPAFLAGFRDDLLRVLVYCSTIIYFFVLTTNVGEAASIM